MADKEKVLRSFGKGDDGTYPYAGMIFDLAGNLYGTTSDGGAHGSGCQTFGCGTVFELTPGTNGKWTEKVLHSFGEGKDALDPSTGLTFDAAGNLYGTTARGGDFGYGAVFRLSHGAKGKWNETVLHSFGKGKDGTYPSSSPIFDAAGSLYSTTADGGAFGWGTVFQLTPGANDEWTERVLHNFNFNGKDGDDPAASLIFDAAGNLYGTTANGGASGSGCGGRGCGTVFRLTPGKNGKWTEKILYSFSSSQDGFLPLGSLVFDVAGNLYGVTGDGGSFGTCDGAGCGTVFELMPGANGKWREKLLHSFGSGQDGFSPFSGPVMDASGNLYGTTVNGGASGQVCQFNGCGTVFRLTPGENGKWTETLLYSFCNAPYCPDGAFPWRSVVLDSAGNLYGTAGGGGAFSRGVVFKIVQ